VTEAGRKNLPRLFNVLKKTGPLGKKKKKILRGKHVLDPLDQPPVRGGAYYELINRRVCWAAIIGGGKGQPASRDG